jgi:enhancing lycopene biosynthesis protein 2
MPRVGVLLSGCGVQDGSEIYESVLTLLALDRAGATIQAMAPDVEQTQVINHYSGQEGRSGQDMGAETRNVLAESARIVRGTIMSTHEVSAHDLEALIIVGGYGVVKNLCSFGIDGVDATVNADIERLIQNMHALGKPIGAMCAGPILVALALRGKHPALTIGSDGSTALSLERLGAAHTNTSIDEILIDDRNNIISTAAFMLAEGPAQAETGINKLVEEVLRRTQLTVLNAATGTTSDT